MCKNKGEKERECQCQFRGVSERVEVSLGVR